MRRKSCRDGSAENNSRPGRVQKLQFLEKHLFRNAATQMRFDQFAAPGLKSQIALIARPDPAGLNRGSRLPVTTAETLIDRIILPGVAARRLAVMPGKSPLRG